MGVNEALSAGGDEQVVLGGTGADQQDVARFLIQSAGLEPCPRGQGEPPVDRAVSQAIAFRFGNRSPAGGEGRHDDADAVEARCRIAPVKPKRAGNQRFGGAGQIGAGHAGLG